jgi:hypothetical protein
MAPSQKVCEKPCQLKGTILDYSIFQQKREIALKFEARVFAKAEIVQELMFFYFSINGGLFFSNYFIFSLQFHEIPS